MNNVLITGVSGGIGECVSRKLIESGSSVIGLDYVLGESIIQTAKEFPQKLILKEADLMNTDNLNELIKTIVDEVGPIGGFVHCAGFDRMLPIHMNKASDVERLWRIHALVPILIIGALSKKKNHADNTSIVLISSQSAHEGAIGHSAYASAKGAIEGFLAPAAAELMDKGIRINEVCFAPIKTPMSANWMNKLDDEGIRNLLYSYPLGIGEVEDASNLICFLMSEDARWINGQIITADGGHSVRKI